MCDIMGKRVVHRIRDEKCGLALGALFCCTYLRVEVD